MDQYKHKDKYEEEMKQHKYEDGMKQHKYEEGMQQHKYEQDMNRLSMPLVKTNLPATGAAVVMPENKTEVCKCGEQVAINKLQKSFRIIGGSESAPHEYPWIVRIVGGCVG